MRQIIRVYRWIAICMCSAFVVAAWLAPSDLRWTKEQFERIEKGMTQSDVEKVLGSPPSSYRDASFLLGPYSPRWCPNEFDRVWVGPKSAIQVVFNKDTKRVTSTYFNDEEILWPRPWYEPAARWFQHLSWRLGF